MTTSLWKPICFGLVVAGIAHVATIMALPNAIMSVAMKRIAATAGGDNVLRNMALVTPQTQTIVRPSPDLAYSICALDLSQGPVRVFIGKGANYASAAFYAANTDNVFTLSDADIRPEGAILLLVSAGKGARPAPDEVLVTLPSDKGLLLIRRLAPTAQDFARVTAERAEDYCRSTTAVQK